MAAVLAEHLLEIVLVAAVGSYFVVGAVVVLFISWRSPVVPRTPFPNGMLWDEKENRLRWEWLFTHAALRHPVAFLLHVALWPLYFSWYLDYLDAEEDEVGGGCVGPTDVSDRNDGV